MSKFIVKYWRDKKPTGARRITVFTSGSYEDVLFNVILNRLCTINYYVDYDYNFLNENVFIKRGISNGPLCIYEVKLYDIYDRSILVSHYLIEIECEVNDSSTDLYEEVHEFEEKNLATRKKEELPTEWYKNESRAIRMFLLFFKMKGTLKKLKNSGLMSKATYHRNLKVCKEKGYIKDGKLTKRLFVSKHL